MYPEPTAQHRVGPQSIFLHAWEKKRRQSKRVDDPEKNKWVYNQEDGKINTGHGRCVCVCAFLVVYFFMTK